MSAKVAGWQETYTSVGGASSSTRRTARPESPARGGFDHRDVGRRQLAAALAEDDPDVPAERRVVGQPVGRGIALGVGDRLGHDVDGHHLPRSRGQGDPDAPGAAEEVVEHLRAVQPGRLGDPLVEPLGHARVRLEERPRRDAQGGTADALLEPVPAERHAGGVAGGGLGDPRVDRVQHPHDLGMGVGQAGRDRVGARLGARDGDEGHQHLPGRDALAHHDVAQGPRLGALVVGGQAGAGGRGAGGLANGVAQRRGQQAGGDIDDLVPAPARVEAEGELPGGPRGGGVLHPVAVAEGLGRRVGREHLHVGEVADPRQVLGHLVALGRQLGPVGHVLQPAAAAARHVRAGRRHPVGPRAQHLHQVGLGEPPPRLRHPGPHPVAGGGVAAEDDEPVLAGDRRPAEGEVAGLELEDVVAARALHAPSIAPWPPPPRDLEEYRRGAGELLDAPGPAADRRLAHLFTAEAVAGLRAQGAPELARFAAEGLLRLASADELAEVRARLSEPVVEGPGGLLAPPEVDAALAAEPDRGRRGALQAARLRALENRLGPLLSDARRRREDAARGAGADSPESLLADAAGLDLAGVAAAGEALLDATDAALGPALAVAAAAALGDPGEPGAADLPRIVRAPQLEAELGSAAAGDAAARARELLELGPPGGPSAPAGGREGLALWLETLGALGSALAAAGASPRLPLERARLADPALARASGLLFEGLAADPGWLARAAGVRDADADAAAGAAGTARLLAARAASARAAGLAGAGGDSSLSRALGLDWPAALSLADGLAGLGAADELRAGMLAAALRTHLREEHGARWFADPRAGRLLRELWLEGGALDPEGLARDLGAPGLDPGLLAAELSASAGP